MQLNTVETICALATAPGLGGLAVIRISGPDAFRTADGVLRQRRRCAGYKGYTLHRAEVFDGNLIVDDVIVAVFKSPHSFTGEDTVEISCHGGSIPVGRTLELLLREGCRAAGPGEFTRRAYLNGKLDLTQAEAVCDLINARTEESYRQALRQKDGALSRAVELIRNDLLSLLARIEASIDFSEDVGELDLPACIPDIDIVRDALQSMLNSARKGIILREGAQVVLVGRPNAGKSSLMNALLRHDRSIVTDVPGTTRDTVEESTNMNGVLVRLWDTAGLRTSNDPVEALGIARSERALESADLVLLIIDSTIGLTDEDTTIVERIGPERLLIVWNKCDLGKGGDLQVSAKQLQGISELEERISTRLLGTESTVGGEEATLTHVHQQVAVNRALECMINARQTIDLGLPADFLSIDVQGALSALGELTGQTATDDVINEIFAKFCIGK